MYNGLYGLCLFVRAGRESSCLRTCYLLHRAGARMFGVFVGKVALGHDEN